MIESYRFNIDVMASILEDIYKGFSMYKSFRINLQNIRKYLMVLRKSSQKDTESTIYIFCFNSISKSQLCLKKDNFRKNVITKNTFFHLS